MKLRISWIVLVVFAALTLPASGQAEPFVGHATLGTPDGMPPAVEDVCDGETGAAYGMCNAYCEAMDCDHSAPQASANACGRVASNFARITGRGLPCDCPCVGLLPDFAESLEGPFAACFDFRDAFGFVGIELADGVIIGAQEIGAAGFCGFAFGGGGALEITGSAAANCNDLLLETAMNAGLDCDGGS